MRLLLCILVSCTIASAAEDGDPVFLRWRERVEPAIERALDYLARIQRSDGSFAEKYGDSTGVPALVGMAFLSKGHTPMEGPRAATINRCIDFILTNQRDDGVFHKGEAGQGPMYAHNISTLFLSEASGMVEPERQAKIDAALPRALKVILKAQAVPKDEQHRGGWRYHPGSRDSDTSCSGWALMALRSAKLNGAAVPDEAITAAVDYLKRHQDSKTGNFGYTDRAKNAETLTGMGLLCLELCGLHGSPESAAAAAFVRKSFRDLPDAQFEFYGNYYNAQAMFQIGGDHWREYADWMYDHYLAKQGEDGSWRSREAGTAYGTAIMTLAFTVPYRQLPIYQRDETVDEQP